MMLTQHIDESITLFGEPFEAVHLWLDEFAGTAECRMRHRQKRHHLKGIEEVRERWGDKAAEVARQHIISDLKMEGWTENDHFPKDEADYQKMGLF